MAEEADPIFEEAVEALRRGDKAGAKDILTRLLKADQGNATYWIWMSASVDTTKERIYCLQAALKLDPENGIAKRGLTLLGALPPDENLQPFPLNRPRAWEEKLLLAHERPKETGLRATLSNPVVRLAGVLVAGIAVVGVVWFALNAPRIQTFLPSITYTPGPSPTFTPTPTVFGAVAQPTKPHAGPTPLAALLGVSYTPTPLYVNTPRSPLSQDMYSGAKAAFNKGDWDTYIADMKQIAQVEPQSPDVLYYIGEGYRFKGDCRSAFDYYNNSLKIDNKFAPGYLGLARARICIDPGAGTLPLYDLALQADANYGEVYLDRANFNLVRKDFNAALPDIDKAAELMPNSALVQLAYANAYLLQGDNTKALAAAQKANSMDLTLLPSYYYLGKTLVADEQYTQAIKPIETYLIYEPEDGSAYALLGQAYAKTGAYQSAVDALNQAVDLDPT
ncbi:MAG TPA: tetratricopeptide repeat protein, partial [Anaerolineales bacterium]|nr:tetratricopeptide repeat protein [Anaerolineales bacterium]